MSPPQPASDKVKYFRATTARIVPDSKTAPTRRKWSDWGECSIACVRTRHRLHCDDLISGSSSSKTPASSQEEASNRKLRNRQVTDDNDDQEQQNDEEDYADQGDEDDGHDSCAQVDTARTFEQQRCAGGQCKLSPESPLPVALRPRTRGSSLAHGNGYAIGNVVGLSGGSPIANSSSSGGGGSLMINVAEPQIELVRHNATTTNHRTGTNAAGLGNWNSAPLIQLTLLIGALAALILLASVLALKLAARSTSRKLKLTPGSYHWMLARQTRHRKRAANCCHLAGTRAFAAPHTCSLESDADADAHSATTRSAQERPLFAGLPPPHSAWRQASYAHQRAARQLFVDAKGRHFALASPHPYKLAADAVDHYYATPDELHCCDSRQTTPTRNSLPGHLRLPLDEKVRRSAHESPPAQSSSSSSSSSLQSTTAQLASSGDSFEQSAAVTLLHSGEPRSSSRPHAGHLYEEITTTDARK